MVAGKSISLDNLSRVRPYFIRILLSSSVFTNMLIFNPQSDNIALEVIIMGIGEKIKIRRKQLGMSQEELANTIGYKSRSSINKIELGINDITQSKVVAFAKVLNTTVSYLMGWEEEKNELDQLLKMKSPKENPNMQKRTLEKVKIYFSSEIYRTLEIMTNFDTDTQKELLKRAEELKMLEEFKK